MAGYVVSTIRAGVGPFAVYEIVTDRLQRLYVSIPRKHTDADTAATIIEHTIAGLAVRSKPIGGP